MAENGSSNVYTDSYDITFVGGGPVGLYGAFYAGMHGMKTKIIEALPQLGGQLAALYPEKFIYDVGGFPKVLAKDLVANLIQQASQFSPTVCTDERVEELKRLPSGDFQLTTAKGTHHTRTLVLTAGIGAFSPKVLDAPGISTFTDAGVYYYVSNLADFEDKSVLVIGGGDSAVDWALSVVPTARNVTLIHRRKGFRAHDDSVRKLFDSAVDVKVHYELRELRGSDTPDTAVIYDNRNGEETDLPVDAVICALGFTPNLGPIKSWGVAFEGDLITVDTTAQTNVPGIFAAGDIVTYPGKLKLIASGFGEVATAVGQAKHLVDPDARIHVHSSNLKMPIAAGTKN